jgi:hypothetical protein
MIEKKKFVKVVTLEGTFPELPSPKMYQNGRGEGSNIKAAFAAAGRDLFRSRQLKGRRLSAFTLTVSVGTREVVEDEKKSLPKTSQS